MISKSWIFMVELATVDPTVYDVKFMRASNWTDLTKKVAALGYADNWRAWRYVGSRGKIAAPKVGD